MTKSCSSMERKERLRGVLVNYHPSAEHRCETCKEQEWKFCHYCGDDRIEYKPLHSDCKNGCYRNLELAWSAWEFRK